MSPGQILALVENETLYKEANPLANPLAIFELGSYYFDSLDLAGDAIAVCGGEWFPTLAWGTGGTPARPLGGGYGTTWTSNTVAAPAPGQIIRYAYNSAATLDKHYFITDYVDMGGYTPANTDDPWIQLDLPRLGLALRDDITASSPGAGGKLYINKGDAGCTEGLLTTGTIQIGLEQISYSARSTDSVTVSARGTGGTTAAAHKAADLVRVVDTDGTATEGYLVQKISWQRHGKSPYPSEFRIRRSNGDSARVPEDNNHDQDYEQLVYVSGYTQSDYEATLSPSRRTTIIIIEIDRMNIDPSRPRINTIKAIADAAQFDSSQVLPDGTTAGALIARILANAGAASNTIIVEAGTVDVGDLTTAAGDSAWSVAADVAAKSATLIDAERGGTIRIKANTLPAGTLSATYAVTNVVAAQVELAQASAKPYGQAKLPYILPDGTKGTAYYPSSIAFAAAPILELAEARYATAGAAAIAARRAYIMAKYPTQFVVELAEPNLALRPGTVASFAWQFASDMQPVSRIGIVMAADHEIQAGNATTVLTIGQVDREAAG